MKKVISIIITIIFVLGIFPPVLGEAEANADEKVTAIVVLEKAPIADIYATKSLDNISGYEEYSNSLKSYQANIISSFSSDIKVLDSYTYLLNGFSVECNLSSFDDIRKIPGVKDVFVAPSYDVSLTKSNNMIYSSYMWNKGFSGSGTAIAILDTGIMPNHIMFQTAPKSSTLKFNKSYINSISSSLHASGNLYVSDKIPFAYDYSQKDNDVTHEADLSDHGTHVAGIAAGSASNIKGVAPDAQIIVMKIFNTAGTNFGFMLSALEDCAILGVDVINMSLGTQNGFTYDYAMPELMAVYDRLESLGISVAVAAGNDYNFGYLNNHAGLIDMAEPDLGVLGSPSSYASTTAVASVENSNYRGNLVMTLEDGTTINYDDTGIYNRFENISSKDYVIIDGTGEESDYNGIDVNGKIAIVSRGGITFSQKADTAYNHGAVGLIVYNNSDENFSMDIFDRKIPCVSITKSDFELLASSGKKTISKAEYLNYTISDFSSWGTTADLNLKPELSAPGGYIYSATKTGYGYKSGTSMATPHIAGAMAIMRKYLASIGISERQLASMTENVLMSTATPVTGGNSVPYSPRLQGAGIINLENAQKANAYITGTNGKSKIELYDDVEKTGVYNLEFTIHNYSKEQMTYNISVDTITHSEGAGYISMYPYRLSPKVEGTGSVTVDAGSEKKVNIKITLSNSDRQYLNQFKNGMFVEGFITLSERYGRNLSVPFMGFYGDWTSQPMFDKIFYDKSRKAPDFGLCEIYTSIGNTRVYPGVNPFDIDAGYDLKYAVLSPNGDGNLDSFNNVIFYLMRNAKEVSITIIDSDGVPHFSYAQQGVRKAFHIGDDKPNGIEFNLVGKLSKVQNSYWAEFKVSAELDFDKHEQLESSKSWGFPVYIDIEKPQLIASALDGDDLTIMFKDNHYIANINVTDENGKEIYSENMKEDIQGKISQLNLNVKNHKSVNVTLTDYAMNTDTFKVNCEKQRPLNVFTLIAEKSGNGTITDEGYSFAYREDDFYYDITPGDGCSIDKILVDGVQVGKLRYRIGETERIKIPFIEENHNIKVYFMEGEKPAPQGDIDGDGYINTLDAVAILEYMAEMRDFDASELHCADYDDNKVIDTRDAVKILMELAED